MPKKVSSVEYMCSWCGMIVTRGPSQGRPSPGNCSRKPKMSNGKGRPHTWVIRRKRYVEI